MEINSNLNRMQVLADDFVKNTFEQNGVQAKVMALPVSQAASIPSTVVTISDEALARQVREADEAGKSTYVEKTPEEYAQMSYEKLIDERNGLTDSQWKDGPLKPIRMYGKAAEAANMKLDNQRMDNYVSGKELGTSLKDFKQDMMKIHPELAKKSFDVSFKDGKAIIVGDGLSKQLKDSLQNDLDNSNNPSATKLQASIAKYNSAGLGLVNMQIYEEKGKYGGVNSIYVHRDDPLTMKEFTEKISYDAVSRSEGGYTYAKHGDVIGSTGYGARLVYKSTAPG